MDNNRLNIERDETSASWLIRGHAEVLDLLKSKALVPLASKELPAEMLEDPSLHNWRKTVQKAYQQQLGWLDEIMNDLLQEQLSSIQKDQPLDLVQAFITPFCQKLAALSIGLDRTSLDPNIFRWAGQVFHMQDSTDRGEGMEATVALAQLIQQLLEKSKTEEKHSFCSVFQDLNLDQGTILSQLIQLFVGMTTSLPLLLANSCHLLLEHTAFKTTFLQKPSAHIQEVLRLAGPTHQIYRFALQDIKIGNQLIKRGDKLAFQLYQANRDPQVFEDELQLKRSAKQHLSFGAGMHSCLGAAIVRNATVNFCTAIFRANNWELMDLEYGGSQSIIGLERLIVSPKKA